MNGHPQVVPENSDNIRSKYGNPRSYVVFGKRYYVMDSASGFIQKGEASWYGPNFHGKRTSSGEPYNMHAMTAAHKTLPLPTYVRVKNLSNGKSVVVKVNDRGPFAHDRIIDLSFAAAKKLSIVGPGVAPVEIVALESENSTRRPTVRVVPLTPPSPEPSDVFIQLGSFGSEDNARKLLNELHRNDEKPIKILPYSTDEGVFYRVRLGPLLDLSEADSVHRRLLKKGYNQARVVVGDE
jgi:rare lipoprotein A